MGYQLYVYALYTYLDVLRLNYDIKNVIIIYLVLHDFYISYYKTYTVWLL